MVFLVSNTICSLIISIPQYHQGLAAHSPEGLWLLQVQLMGMVVGQDEGEDGVLHEIVESPPSQLVQLHQVLKVGDLSLLPAVGGRGREERCR